MSDINFMGQKLDFWKCVKNPIYQKIDFFIFFRKNSCFKSV